MRTGTICILTLLALSISSAGCGDSESSGASPEAAAARAEFEALRERAGQLARGKAPPTEEEMERFQGDRDRWMTDRSPLFLAPGGTCVVGCAAKASSCWEGCELKGDGQDHPTAAPTEGGPAGEKKTYDAACVRACEAELDYCLMSCIEKRIMWELK